MILSVQSSEDDIIRALDNGANDYLVKPFRTGELLARIRTALRGKTNQETHNNQIINANLVIDLPNRIVKKDNEIIKLTPTEYNLLILFAKNEGKVLTHQYIFP